MKIARHILLLLAAALGLAACSGRARIIPEKQLEAIYEEMFLADQWLSDHIEYKWQADTTLLFDPIFARHGYDYNDYDATVRYYAARPQEYWDLVNRVSDNIAAKAEFYTKMANDIATAERTNIQNRLKYSPSDFNPDDLPIDLTHVYDSLYRKDSLKWVKLPSHLAVSGQTSASDSLDKKNLLEVGEMVKFEESQRGVLPIPLKKTN